jgi:predicted acyltransferase
VLPRIAICYLIIATFYLLSTGWRNKVVVAVAALVGYWILMRYVPVPGYGVPGRDIPLLDHDANLVAWLDRHIFSAPHLYERTRDPEGLLSTIPALATTLMGLLTGLWLRTSHTLAEKARGIASAAFLSLIAGGLWNFIFPINKKLWTSSYVLFAGGLSLLLLALCMWIVDLRRQTAKPGSSTEPAPWLKVLLVFGTNAIFAYVLSELLASVLYSIHLGSGVTAQQAIYQAIHGVIANAPFASLVYSLLFVAVCWLPTLVLYRKKIFLKV